MTGTFRILFWRELVEQLRTPASLFWIFGLPLFYLALMFFSYGRDGAVGPVVIEVVDHDQSALSRAYVADVGKVVGPAEMLRGDIVVVDPGTPVGSGHIRITFPPGFATAALRGEDTRIAVDYSIAGEMATQILLKIFEPLTTSFNGKLGQSETPVGLEFHSLGGERPVGFSQYMVTGIVVMAMMSAAMSRISALITLRREQNLFKLMACLPVGRVRYLLAMLCARLVVVTGGALLLLFLAVLLFDLPIDLGASALGKAAGVIVVGNMALLALGILLASRAASVERANFVATAVFVLLLFLSDITTPLRSLPMGPREFLSFLPTAQFAAALRAVVVQGTSLVHEWMALATTLAWTLGFLVTACALFRWHRS
jgi:ABC-2 type transport system permease protein